jgi:hypothetical protein
MRKAFLLLFCLLALSEAQGQSVSQTELKKNYIGTMDKVLTAIGADHNIRFVFDADSLRTVKLTLYAFEHNKLGDLFKEWTAYLNLVVWSGKNRTVYIAGKSLPMKDRQKWAESMGNRPAQKEEDATRQPNQHDQDSRD